jgi:hypothetical protein
VVAVAEPRDPRRARFAVRHQLPPGAAVAELGYHLLLEKPMATTEAGCRRIVEAVERAGVLFAVCHVLRYTPYTALVKQVVDAGRLGQVISVQHLEPVGFLHQAHSYVRGPWRRDGGPTGTFTMTGFTTSSAGGPRCSRPWPPGTPPPAAATAAATEAPGTVRRFA